MSNEVNQTKKYEARNAYRNEVVANKYDSIRFSSFRGRSGNYLDNRALSAALACLSGSHGMVLDIPCGTGRITEMIASAGHVTVASDISAEMINVARKRFPHLQSSGLKSVQNDAALLPFGDNEFICVTAIRFMGHIPSEMRIEMLRQFARVSQRYIIVDYSVLNPFISARRWLENSVRTNDWGFNKTWSWEAISKRQLLSEFRAANVRAVRWVRKAPLFSDASFVVLEKNG